MRISLKTILFAYICVLLIHNMGISKIYFVGEPIIPQVMAIESVNEIQGLMIDSWYLYYLISSIFR